MIDFIARGLFDGPKLKGRVIDGADHLLITPNGSYPDVRMGLTDFDPQAGIYRISVDFTYYR